jgi:adenosine deaminase
MAKTKAETASLPPPAHDLAKDLMKDPGKIPLVPISLPKAEMHIHIGLALSHEVFLRRIQKGRTPIKADFLIDRSLRYYDDLAQHHATYEQMRHITSTPGELAQVTQDYLERIAREGAIYAELSTSYRDAKTFDAMTEAVAEGIRCARANTGIEARIVVTAIRNFGASEAEIAAKHLVKRRHPLVTGFGMAGEENLDPFGDYSKALHIAWHEAGLGLAPHVAEQYVHNAVDFLAAIPKEAVEVHPDDHRRLRAGHATLIHLSSELMQQFAEHQICIEACLSANKRINLPSVTRAHGMGETVTTATGRSITLDRPLRTYFKNLWQHPLKDFVAAGIPVCLGSDNPLLQNTNIGKENSLAMKARLTDLAGALQMTENAIKFANVDMMTRLALLQKVDLYRTSVRAGKSPTATAFGYKRAFDTI